MFSIQIQTANFNTANEEACLRQKVSNCGAQVSFCGLVRANDYAKELDYLYIEHYENVTQNEIMHIINLAKNKWQIKAVRLIHRVGIIKTNEQIILLLVLAAHRTEAFFAAEFIIDYLKTCAPFWKKEYFKDGTSSWVCAKKSDVLAKEKWNLG